MQAWIVGLRWFGWLVLLLMLGALCYAGIRTLQLYPMIAV